jgi:hypothetical protein
MNRAGIALTILLLALSFGGAQTRRPKKPAPPPTPLSYSKVLEGIEGIAKGSWKEDEFIQKVRNQKVDFPATDAVKENLRSLGASEHVIQAIVEVAPAPQPDLTPKKMPTGALIVHCSPAECEISLNGQPAGSSEHGELTIGTVPAGEITVDVTRKGYIAKQESVKIVAGGSTPLTVTLEPDNSTKTELGRQELQAMLKTIGLVTDRKALWTLAGTGSATAWSAGKSSEWNIDFAFGAPNLLKMDAHGPDGNLTLLCRGDHCEPKKKGGFLGGKSLPTPAIEGLTTNLIQFARYHLAILLDQMTSPSSHPLALAFENPEEHEQHFTVETADVSYDVTIDSELRLTSIVSNPKSGLGAGLTVTFGSFLKVESFWYPRHTDIKLPGDSQHGIQIRFDSLREESNFHEKDFPK